jgi:poly(A) polymerase
MESMISDLPGLAKAEWLARPGVRQIFALIENGGEEVRIVGGAVRNALMGVPVRDEFDFATTAAPEKATELAAAAGIKVVPTGVEHGTVTLVIAGKGYEVTTLREDMATDGRRAVVRFGRDWAADALRRDFTVNALSVDSTGHVHDPVGGYPDVVARRIRFIGDPATRIAEDRLRILRFFRFQALYGEGALDPAGLSAVIRGREGLRELSAERIGQEMRRIVVAPRAAEIVALMQEAGILTIVLGGVGYLAQFARAVHGEAAVTATPAAATRLAALACRIDEDAARVTERLRLSNAERDRILATLTAARVLTPLPGDREARRALYRLGPEAYRDGLIHAFGWSGTAQDPAAWRSTFALPSRWTAPAFPLGGRDVIAGGVSGAAVGAILRDVEAWWIEQDFAPDEAVLRAQLQQMLAAAQ